MNWQPIAAAPVGQRILVSNEKGNVLITRLAALRWYDDSGRLVAKPRWWMTLPQAPRAPELVKPGRR